MKKLYLLPLLLAGFALVNSCEEEPIPTHNYTFNDLDQAFDEIAPQEQTFTLDATTGGTITAELGTQLIFGPHVLQNASGDIIEGSVVVRIIEILDVEDMISSGILPIDLNGHLLNSGGELYVNITQGGQTLSIAPGSYYTIKMPSNGNDAEMDWYIGTGDVESGMWDYTPAIIDSFGAPTLDDPYYDELMDVYTIITDVLGWMNCDALAEFGIVDMHLHLTGLTDIEEMHTGVYYLPDLLMTCSTLWGIWSEPDNMLSEVPIYDSPGYILITTLNLGEFYYGLVPVDPEEGLTLEVPLTAATMEDFEAALDALW